MTSSTKLDEKLEGAENFRAWRFRVMLVMREQGLVKHVTEDVPEPEEDEAKEKHFKDQVKAMRIIADSIKNHLIPQVSSLETPKEMLDSLTRMFEGKNINRKMTLRQQLKNVKMQSSESIHSYFSRANQIREQMEAIGDAVENEEIVMSTLNGLPRVWDGFIQGVCTRRKNKLPKFKSLWEEAMQEEARKEARDEKIGSTEDQALAAQTKKRKEKKFSGSPRKARKSGKHFDKSKVICFHCDEAGHYRSECPKLKG